jgi:hypothetical protein
MTLRRLQNSLQPPDPVSGRLLYLAGMLWRDIDGLVLPYVTMLLVVIVGLSVLALDGARYMGLQTELQNRADSLALAGAAELDRFPDAQARAIRAINNLIPGVTQNPGADGTAQISRIDFYAQLPADDAKPISDGALATDGTNARFVSVTMRPLTLNTILPAALFWGSNAISAGAAAVAGFDQVVCRATPLYVCNPFETPGMSYDQASGALQNALSDPAIRRRLLRLRYFGDRHEPLLAADYGFLDLPVSAGTSMTLVEALASVRPSACFVQNAVNLRPGAASFAREAFNVRFDIYEGAMSGRESDADYSPAANVRKGYVGGACNARAGTDWPIGRPPAQVTGRPLDRQWPYLDGRMGNGNWNFDTYWHVNHGGSGRSPPTVNGEPATNSNLPSRYEVYRYEIDEGYVSDRSLGGESGAAACYRGNSLREGPDRRVLQAAIINCHSLGLADGIQFGVPVAAFAKLFLTLPLQASQSDLYVEMIGLMKPGDNGNFDMVQLYR